MSYTDLPHGVEIYDVARIIRKGQAEWTSTPGAPLPEWATQAIDHFFDRLHDALDRNLGPDGFNKSSVPEVVR